MFATVLPLCICGFKKPRFCFLFTWYWLATLKPLSILWLLYNHFCKWFSSSISFNLPNSTIYISFQILKHCCCDGCEKIEINRWINNKERHKDLTWFTLNDYVHGQRVILLMEELQRSVYRKIRSSFSTAAN